MKPELSKKNDYWISKDRFYELKHFCLQYPEWKKLYSKLEGELLPKCVSERELTKLNEVSNPTERIAILRAGYKAKMDMVEEAAHKADEEIELYLINAVTLGYSYTKLYADGIPCSRDTYYDRYRKFFWELSRLRD